MERTNSSLHLIVPKMLILLPKYNQTQLHNNFMFQVAAVNVSNKVRDTESEAKMLPTFPEAIPPNFQRVHI